ncbi:RNB domain-containing ribonuclease [Piscinibacter sp. XHJ-5]|uniref:RNB domain-containing ribonuclease n=1 Tax=Piscinibacter sp. XHJ-5 TaxID=3037797 RepID=UPI00245335F6|nr:RNB domain-containing ribonuclease [Piscinibacter sp. XHJ-5]
MTLLPPDNLMEGVVSAHPRGFGFVEQDGGESYFVSPPQMRSLVPGDRVRFGLIPGRGQQPPSAVVQEVLRRPETFWLGQLEPAEGGHRLRADDPLHAPVVVSPTATVLPDEVVQLRIAEGAGVGQPMVPASLVANLGPRNDRDFDVRYAIAKWRLPEAFGDDALQQARACAEPSLAQAREVGLEDLTQLPFVTIDGESTRDFDDAVCLVDDGAQRTLHVAIADVSRYVAPGTPLDAQARARGTSVYLPDRSLPMLPPELSNGLCSLNPGALRHALVCSLRYSPAGQPTGYSFARALIRSAARLTYGQVAAGDVPAAVQPMMRDLWAWFETQQAARAQRGLLEYRSAEPRLVIRDDGAYDIEWVSPARSNELVEEAMLAANRAAAAHLTLLGAGLLFRHQEGLDTQRWEQTRRWLVARGIAAPALPTLSDLRALLAGVGMGAAIRPQVEFRIRQAMTPAIYDDAHSTHFSLGFRAYTHFTSPIRRYADLVVHRLLLGEAIEADAALSEHLSARARAARQASRYPWERLKRRLVWRRGEHEHRAQLVSSNARGLKAALAGWEVLARVDADVLEPQGWTWDRTQDAWCREDRLLEPGSELQLRLIALIDEGPQCELRATMAPPSPARGRESG